MLINVANSCKDDSTLDTMLTYVADMCLDDPNLKKNVNLFCLHAFR